MESFIERHKFGWKHNIGLNGLFFTEKQFNFDLTIPREKSRLHIDVKTLLEMVVFNGDPAQNWDLTEKNFFCLHLWREISTSEYNVWLLSVSLSLLLRPLVNCKTFNWVKID